MKKILSIVILLTILALPVSSLASGIQPFYNHFGVLITTLRFDGNTAIMNCTAVYNTSNTDKVTVDSELQEFVNGRWQYVTSFSKTSTGNYLACEFRSNINRSGYFRLKSTFNAYRNGVLVETDTVYATASK